MNDVNFIGEIVEVNNAEALRKLAFALKNELQNYLVVLTANIEAKAQVAVMIDEAVVSAKGMNAATIIKKQVAALIKGGGGGQATFATAGGPDATNLPLVIDAIKGLL
jgi:alanyl-tRNA synthetase